MREGYCADALGGRLRASWTQEALAQAVGCAQGTISRYKSGIAKISAEYRDGIIGVCFKRGGDHEAKIEEFKESIKAADETRLALPKGKVRGKSDRSSYKDYWRSDNEPNYKVGRLLDFELMPPPQDCNLPDDFKLQITASFGTDFEKHYKTFWEVGLRCAKIYFELENCRISEDLVGEIPNVTREARCWIITSPDGEDFVRGQVFPGDSSPARLTWIDADKEIALQLDAECNETDVVARLVKRDDDRQISRNQEKIAQKLIQKIARERSGGKATLGHAQLRWTPPR